MNGSKGGESKGPAILPRSNSEVTFSMTLSMFLEAEIEFFDLILVTVPLNPR